MIKQPEKRTAKFQGTSSPHLRSALGEECRFQSSVFMSASGPISTAFRHRAGSSTCWERNSLGPLPRAVTLFVLENSY